MLLILIRDAGHEGTLANPSQVIRHALIPTSGQFIFANSPAYFLGCGRKSENPEEAHYGRTCKTSHLVLWGDSTTEFTTMPIPVLSKEYLSILINSSTGCEFPNTYFSVSLPGLNNSTLLSLLIIALSHHLLEQTSFEWQKDCHGQKIVKLPVFFPFL